MREKLRLFSYLLYVTMVVPAFCMEQDSLPLIEKPSQEWLLCKDVLYEQVRDANKETLGVEIEIQEALNTKQPRVKVMGNLRTWGNSRGSDDCLDKCIFASLPYGTLACCGCAISWCTLPCQFSTTMVYIASGFTGGACCFFSPLATKVFILKRKAQTIAHDSSRFLTAKFNLHNHLIKYIKAQNTKAVCECLDACADESLEEYRDLNGDAPLDLALAYADRKKDPERVIIKELIAHGCPLWYSKKPKVKDGHATNELREPLPFEQPLIKIVNRQDLHKTILKPLIQIAAQGLSQKK